MPKLVNVVPKYRKHRQSGQAIVTLNGHDHLLGPHGTRASRVEYDRLIAEWLASGRSASFGAPVGDLLIVELIADYLRHAKAYHGTEPGSEWHHAKPVLKALKNMYGRTAATAFGPLQLKALRQTCVGLGWSRSYLNANIRRVVRIFRWASSEGRLPPAIPHALSMVAGLRAGKTEAPETAPVLPVDAATVDATLPHLPAVVADMVRFQRLTGCRPAEVCLLRPCDVDRSGDVWVYRPEHHKTEHHGRGRVILIGPKAQEVVLRYLARDAKAYCFRPCDSEAKRRAAASAARTTPLSCGNKPGSNKKRAPRKRAGESYNSRSYHAAIRRACIKVDLAPWAPNRLRHAAATEIRREFGLEAAQVVLGHSKADVTQVYAERDMAKGLEVARRIG